MCRAWTDPPEDKCKIWDEVFAEPHDDVFSNAPCPICGETELVQFFLVGRPIDDPVCRANGAGWQFCMGCNSRVHFSGCVPKWWHSDLVVSGYSLTREPNAIVEAIEARRIAERNSE